MKDTGCAIARAKGRIIGQKQEIVEYTTQASHPMSCSQRNKDEF
jgi:hypothetical protein